MTTQTLTSHAKTHPAPVPGALRYILFATAVSALGGFLFGYDTAVIADAIGFIQKHFALSAFQKGTAGASAIIGCIPGAMFAGFFSDRFGRKKVLFLCALLYCASGIWSAVPHSFAEFIIARFFGGLGIGASSMICPTYIAELAPEKHRGRLGTLFQLGIVIGIFLVFFVNMMIQKLGDEAWNTALGWRWMLASESLPAAGFFALLFTVPESPRWLAQNGFVQQARSILERMMGTEQAERELAAIAQVSGEGEGRFVELFDPALRRPLIIAVALAVFCQFSGINAIMYYAPEVFKTAGASTDSAFAASVWVSAVNLLATFVAIAFVDKAGRKPLLAIGAALQTLALGWVGWEFHIKGGGIGLLAGVMGFVAAFAMAMGPIPWIVISEIFPGRIRGRAVAVGVFMIWVSCFVVAQTFPTLNDKLGGAVTFWIYAGCSLASLLFVLFYLPETKGRSLEEIEASWRKH